MASKAWRWIRDRFGLQEIRENFLFRRVPKDAWYEGDGMAMVLLFVIQVITGMVLALSYSPTIEGAYESVQRITTTQALGWFVRGVHYWAGGLRVALLFYHLMRQILIGGYKSPREGTWLLGVVLLVLVVVMSLVGYILRWDERGLYGLRVALNMFHEVPWIGPRLVLLIQGGWHITELTLSRLYAAHVVLGPMLLGMLIFYHLYLVVVRGTTSEAEKEQPIHSGEHQKQVYKREAHHPERGEWFFPYTQIRLSPIPIATLLAVIGLTVWLGPRELMGEANLTETPYATEEWWFGWYSALAALLPGRWAPTFHWVFPLLVLGILLALPLMDQWKENRGARDRPIAVTIVCMCVLAVFWLSALRQRSSWTAWPGRAPPGVPTGVTLTERAERGRQLFAEYGCNSCHAVAGDGPKFAPDMARMRHRYSLEEIRRYVLEPPAGVAMPSYRGRMQEEELALVVEFCHVAQTFPREQ